MDRDGPLLAAARLCWQVFWWGFVAPLVVWPLQFCRRKLPFFEQNPQAFALFLPCFLVMACYVFAGYSDDTEQLLALIRANEGGKSQGPMPLPQLNLAAKVIIAVHKPALWAKGLASVVGRPALWLVSWVSWVVGGWLLYAPFYFAAAYVLRDPEHLIKFVDAWRQKLKTL